jgi:hypothetical protein
MLWWITGTSVVVTGLMLMFTTRINEKAAFHHKL